MKRLRKFFLVAVMLTLAGTAASARGLIIKGGAEFPHYNLSDLKDFDVSTIVGWHAGAGYQSESFAGFTFQPELMFQHTGLSVKGPDNFCDVVRTNSIQVLANVQWGPDLIIFRPYIFAAPFASYNLSGTSDILNLKKWDYGVGVGLGIDVWKLQISAKYNWAFSGVVDWPSYVEGYKNISANTGSVVVSLGFCF